MSAKSVSRLALLQEVSTSLCERDRHAPCRRIALFGLLMLLILTLSPVVVLGAQPPAATVPTEVHSLLNTHCVACHGPDSQEGDVRLDTLATLEPDARLDLLNTMHEVIRFEQMPPEGEPQPTDAERQRLEAWIAAAVSSAGPSKLEEKLLRPDYGNRIDHDQLFSGKYAHLPGFTYDRRWLISEYIFDAKFNRILEFKPSLTIDGTRQQIVGYNNRGIILTNPFLLPTNTGVRYYANETLNGGHLLTMITNAKVASTHMFDFCRRHKQYLPAIVEIMAREWEHERVLAARETFLRSFIDRVLHDLYQDKHEAFLPAFVPVSVKSTESANGDPTAKAPYHAAILGRDEMILIFHTALKHQKAGDSDDQFLEKCEREWFNFGHDNRNILARTAFLNKYMDEWRADLIKHNYAAKHKPPEYRPLPPDEMKVVAETILRHRARGDRFNAIIDKCMAQWRRQSDQDLTEAGPPHDKLVAVLVDQLFVKILERTPDPRELDQYVAQTRSYIDEAGNSQAIKKLIETLILRSDFVYRCEFGQGKADEHGRRMLSPRDASYAIAYAITDSSPDPELALAAADGRLVTRDDYRREVERLLSKRDQYYVIDESADRSHLTDNFTNMPIRELRFIRDFFGYPMLLPIFKDNKRFGGDYDTAKVRLVSEADRLVESILEKDRQVFERLLTTQEFYVYHSGDNEAMRAAAERIRRIYDHFKDEDWQNFTTKDILKHHNFIQEVKMRGMGRGPESDIKVLNTVMTSFTLRFDKGQTAAAPYNSFPSHGPSNASTRSGGGLGGVEVAKFFNIAIDNWNYPTTQPAKVEHRKGLLTHPAWLIAHAKNTETDPVIRGKWIREKLLADSVPDVPITVDAVIPEDPHKTLRQRLDAKTGESSCWKCHRKMNPLGLTFEIYDDFGRYRTEERLEYPENLIQKNPDKGAPHVDLRDLYKTLPVDARGYLDGTGDDRLDGEVADALELIDRLAQSQRVRQSIIRHAFRYFMGRNELLSDSKTLIDADQAYVNSGGSFDAVIVSLLTSDSFIYRKAIEE